jgi:hypothetical protein
MTEIMTSEEIAFRFIYEVGDGPTFKEIKDLVRRLDADLDTCLSQAVHSWFAGQTPVLAEFEAAQKRGDKDPAGLAQKLALLAAQQDQRTKTPGS